MTDTDKATHTPGPWMAGIHADGIEIACQDASAGYMPLAMVYDGLGSEHDGEGDANAALIAQAPTLLAERDDLRAKLAEAEARADAERAARHTREGLYDILQARCAALEEGLGRLLLWECDSDAFHEQYGRPEFEESSISWEHWREEQLRGPARALLAADQEAS